MLMKSQRYPSSIIKVDAVLYSAHADEDDGKVTVRIHEWVVRSIQKKRGSQSRFGFKNVMSLDDRQYVNITKKVPFVTWGKRSSKNGDYGWLSSIDPLFRKQFAVGNDLPSGVYTTKLAALKSALKSEEFSMERVKKYIKENDNPDWKQELEDDLASSTRITKALRSQITRLQNKSKAEGANREPK